MTVEIISRSISRKVWDGAGMELATPGSAVRLASVARHVTDVSGNRFESDCRSRGRELDPGPDDQCMGHTFSSCVGSKCTMVKANTKTHIFTSPSDETLSRGPVSIYDLSCWWDIKHKHNNNKDTNIYL